MANPGVATLCVDVGGSAVKAEVLAADGSTTAGRVRVPVHYPVRPADLVGYVEDLRDQLPAADRITVGFPGMVRAGRVLTAPHFVTAQGPGSRTVPALLEAWTGYPLADVLQDHTGCPTRLGNDADVAGLAVIAGNGIELVLTLGTGLGTALFHNGVLAPHLELAHHPFRKGDTYNEQVGDAARRRIGNRRWSKRVGKALDTLSALVLPDTVYVGGGNSARLKGPVRDRVQIVDNINGIIGGLRLWDQPHPL